MTTEAAARLAQIRQAIEDESVSYGEIAELQSLAEFIDPADTVLLEWAGVPESREERRFLLTVGHGIASLWTSEDTEDMPLAEGFGPTNDAAVADLIGKITFDA